MLSLHDLRSMIDNIEAAMPCAKHGREFLEICEECRETVRCSECYLIGCQCWNDE